MRDWRGGVDGTRLFFQLSTLLITAIVVPLLLGVWLDRTFGTAPFSTLCLSILGVLVGTVAIYRAVNREYRRIGGRKG